MKGIAHFLSGIAVATFVPGAVHLSAQDSSYIIALGGVFALMPDTLDFRFARYLDQVDASIDPDPRALDAQAIAEQLAKAVKTAFDHDRRIVVQLQTIRLGADLWRQYSIHFVVDTNEIVVRLGPIVNTSKKALPDSLPTGVPLEGRAEVEVPIDYQYDPETRVDIFGGPSFAFRKAGTAVKVDFLPWHRRWSHSLILALILGGVVGLLLGTTAGLIAGLGYATHVLEDQFGHMGSNLFWPITRERFPGLQWMHSDSDLPNFLTVWLSLAWIFFNLDRFSVRPQVAPGPYLIYAVIIPAALMLLLYVRQLQRQAAGEGETAEQETDAKTQNPQGA